MIVGVTGANGFLGWHLRCRLLIGGVQTISATRQTFASPEMLDQFVRSADVIVHAAGVNRANSEAEVVDGNKNLAADLVAAMKRTESVVPVIYTNSVKSEEGGVYGQAKQAASDLLRQFLTAAQTPFADLVLPHLIGEFGQPFYNSAVTTFAHQLAIGQSPSVNGSAELELLHAQDVSGEILDLVNGFASVRRRIPGRKILVGEAWDLLEHQHRRYVTEQTIPAFASRFEQLMFNVLRSQLYVGGHYPRKITRHEDARGAFSELCRADGLGQTSISTSAPGVTRGDHFHLEKIERFVVVGGSARIRLRRLLTDEVQSFDVNANSPALIDMPPLVTHNITNIGDGTLTTMFWAGDHFDPAVPDTYPEAVSPTAEPAQSGASR